MIRDLPAMEKPREKAQYYGISSLSDAELLAILIRTGTKNYSALDISYDLIKEVGEINNFNLMTIEKLKGIKGLGKSKAITILSALEFGKRTIKSNELNYKVKSSKDIYDKFKYYFLNKKQEILIIVFLTHQKKVISFKSIYQGTINNLSINQNEIFKEAIIHMAPNIILIHNHPNDSFFPSKEDLESTKKIVASGKLLNINIVDHIIITNKNYYSFYDNGDIK